jgi:hypothetical protein
MFDGFQWQSLGQAQISVASDGLHVTNVGSTGDDGVRLLLPAGFNPTSLDAAIFGSGLGTSSPTGAFLQETPRGTVNGIAGQPVDHFTATTLSGGGVGLAVDMSPIAPASLTAFYYNQGALVLTETGLPDIYVPPSKLPTPGTWWDYHGGGWDWVFAVPVPTFGGGVVESDLALFYPVGSAVTFGNPVSIDYTGSQIGGFVIGGVSSVPEPSFITLLCLAMTGLVLLRRRFLNLRQI